MARPRARSSFTVEVRRGRTNGTESDPKKSLWRGVDLAAEASRHEAAPADPFVKPAAPRTGNRTDIPAGARTGAEVPPAAQQIFAPAAPRREASAARILPSLLEQAPAPVEEVDEAPHREERLPRVRRVRPRPAKAEALPVEPEDDAEDDAQAPPTSAEPAFAEIRVRRRQPRAEKVLRAGERWKRRLPRALW